MAEWFKHKTVNFAGVILIVGSNPIVPAVNNFYVSNKYSHRA